MSRLAFLVSLLVVLFEHLGYRTPTRLHFGTGCLPGRRYVRTGWMWAQTRAVIEPYVAALGALEDIAPYLADDVVLTLVEVNQEIQGRDAVAGAIVELHQQTFDARPEVVNLIVGEGKAAGESSSSAPTPESSLVFRHRSLGPGTLHRLLRPRGWER